MRRAGLAASTMAVVAAATVVAQDLPLNRTGSGARAAGMGNAFVAVSDDGTAASWNPAGLSQLQKPEFSLVHSASQRDRYLEGFRTRDETAAYTTLGTGSSTASIEFASAAIPFRLAGKPVTLQVGWRRLYQLKTQVNGDVQRVVVSEAARPGASIHADSTTEGSINLWSFAGAVRFTDRLSVGWSLDLYSGEWEERANLGEEPGVLGPADFLWTTGSNHVAPQHTLTLGVLLTYPSLSVGLVHHGALRGGFSQEFSGRSSLGDQIDVQSSPGSQLRFPRSVGAGLAWRPRPLLRLALDLTWDEWTQFLVEDPSSGRTWSALDGLPSELSAARDTVSVNAGMEKLFPVKGAYVPLRLGAAYEPQGYRDPLQRDSFDYFVLATGTGVNTNSLKFDVALEYRWGSLRNSRDISVVYQVGRAGEFGLPPSPEAQGTDRFQEWRLKASVIYRVTETEKLRELLKRVFGS